jgi:hypothetical protein
MLLFNYLENNFNFICAYSLKSCFIALFSWFRWVSLVRTCLEKPRLRYCGEYHRLRALNVADIREVGPISLSADEATPWNTFSWTLIRRLWLDSLFPSALLRMPSARWDDLPKSVHQLVPPALELMQESNAYWVCNIGRASRLWWHRRTFFLIVLCASLGFDELNFSCLLKIPSSLKNDQVIQSHVKFNITNKCFHGSVAIVKNENRCILLMRFKHLKLHFGVQIVLSVWVTV